MALILIFAWAKAEKKRAAMPLAFRIPSPTTEIMERSLITSILSNWCAANSCANSFSNTFNATSTNLIGTQKLMLYSEEDCVIKITDTLACDIAEKTRAAIPTMPCMPGPEMLNMATLSKLVMPLTCNSSDLILPAIMEPGAIGLPVFLIKHGIFGRTNGPIVRG